MSLPLLELSLGPVLCGVTGNLLCKLTKYTAAGTVLIPGSAVGMLLVGPGVPQALRLQNCRWVCTSLDPVKSGSRTRVTAVRELRKQLRPWPGLRVRVLPHSPQLPRRPVPAFGAPVVYLDVLQVLSMKSWQPRHFP